MCVAAQQSWGQSTNRLCGLHVSLRSQELRCGRQHTPARACGTWSGLILSSVCTLQLVRSPANTGLSSMRDAHRCVCLPACSAPPPPHCVARSGPCLWTRQQVDGKGRRCTRCGRAHGWLVCSGSWSIASLRRPWDNGKDPSHEAPYVRLRVGREGPRSTTMPSAS